MLIIFFEQNETLLKTFALKQILQNAETRFEVYTE